MHLLVLSLDVAALCYMSCACTAAWPRLALAYQCIVDSQQRGISRPSIKGHACGTVGGRLQSLQQYAPHIE